MFAHVLYTDDELSLHLNWFGFGSLAVIHHSGKRRRAHALQKRFFRAVCDDLVQMGVRLTPEDPVCRAAFGDLARSILDSPLDGLLWRTAFNFGPQAYARSYFDEENR